MWSCVFESLDELEGLDVVATSELQLAERFSGGCVLLCLFESGHLLLFRHEWRIFLWHLSGIVQKCFIHSFLPHVGGLGESGLRGWLDSVQLVLACFQTLTPLGVVE